MSLKKTIIKDTLQYTFANYMAMALGIGVSILTKALLGTVGAGLWALLKVFGSYGEYSDLGTRDAMLREIPQSIGANDRGRCEKIENSAFSFTLAAAVFSAIVLCLIAVLAIHEPVLKKGVLIVALLVIATQIYNYFLTLLRTLKKVKALSIQIVLNMVFVAVFSLGGAMAKGVLGLAVGFVIATALSAWMARKNSEVKLRIDFNWFEISKLLKIGLPMVGLSYVLITFLSIDTLMIGKMIGYPALGLYTIALMSVQQVSTLGRFSHIILFPHIQEKYGQTGSLEASKPFFIRATYTLMHFLPVLIAGVVFFVPMIVHYAIPKFEGGIPAMKILVMGYYFIAVNEMSSSVLFTINRQTGLIPIYLLMALWAAGLNYVFISQGWGILGVAVATSIAYFSFFLIVFCYAFSRILDVRNLLKMLVTAVALFIYLFVFVHWIDRAIRMDAVWLEAFCKFLIFLAVFFPVLWSFEKRENILRSVWSLLAFKIKETVCG